MPRIYKKPREFQPKRKSASSILAASKLRSKRKKNATASKNMTRIDKLTREVAKLKTAEYGQKQISRQICSSIAGLPNSQSARISANFPVCFCHQAIDLGNQLYQVEVDAVTGAIVSNPVANWRMQAYPLLALDPLSEQFDQLKYLQTNNNGLQAGYLHQSSNYQMKFEAVNWRGWVDVLVVTTRNQYTRQSGPDVDVFQLPGGLAGFSNTCGGTPNQYSWNPSFYGVKRVKRMYFNTQVPTTDSEAIYSNPDKFSNLTLRNDKYRSHIRAQTKVEYAPPPTPPTTPITHLDMPLRQQDWVVITASNPTAPSATSYLAVSLLRAAVFRDALGSS